MCERTCFYVSAISLFFKSGKTDTLIVAAISSASPGAVKHIPKPTQGKLDRWLDTGITELWTDAVFRLQPKASVFQALPPAYVHCIMSDGIIGKLISRRSVCVSVCLCVYVCVYMSVCLSLSVCLSIYRSM